MAQIVSLVASTHNPRIFWNRDQAEPDDVTTLETLFLKVRGMLASTTPDVIVCIANDHLDSFFFDNLPAFAVGSGSTAAGPFWYENEVMNIPKFSAPVHQELAQFLLRHGVEEGIPFSQVSDIQIDHAFTIPLSFLRSERNLPIVPIMTNAFGYPLPSNRRWYELGQFLCRALKAWPSTARVAVVGSFNLLVEVGGPKMGSRNIKLQQWILDQMRDGNRDAMLEKLTVPTLIAEGNSSVEFLNYVACLGIVEDRKPSFIENKMVKGIGGCPIAFWDLTESLA